MSLLTSNPLRHGEPDVRLLDDIHFSQAQDPHHPHYDPSVLPSEPAAEQVSETPQNRAASDGHEAAEASVEASAAASKEPVVANTGRHAGATEQTSPFQDFTVALIRELGDPAKRVELMQAIQTRRNAGTATPVTPIAQPVAPAAKVAAPRHRAAPAVQENGPRHRAAAPETPTLRSAIAFRIAKLAGEVAAKANVVAERASAFATDAPKTTQAPSVPTPAVAPAVHGRHRRTMTDRLKNGAETARQLPQLPRRIGSSLLTNFQEGYPGATRAAVKTKEVVTTRENYSRVGKKVGTIALAPVRKVAAAPRRAALEVKKGSLATIVAYDRRRENSQKKKADNRVARAAALKELKERTAKS